MTSPTAGPREDDAPPDCIDSSGAKGAWAPNCQDQNGLLTSDLNKKKTSVTFTMSVQQVPYDGSNKRCLRDDLDVQIVRSNLQDHVLVQRLGNDIPDHKT